MSGMINLLKSWIESYEKDSNTYRVLVGKSGNILKLMKQVRKETLKKARLLVSAFDTVEEADDALRLLIKEEGEEK